MRQFHAAWRCFSIEYCRVWAEVDVPWSVRLLDFWSNREGTWSRKSLNTVKRDLPRRLDGIT